MVCLENVGTNKFRSFKIEPDRLERKGIPRSLLKWWVLELE